MPLGVQVDTVHPVDIAALSGVPFQVVNVGSQTVYYKQGVLGAAVTPTSNDGSILAGETFTITQATWVIAKEPGAQLDFRNPTVSQPSEAVTRTVIQPLGATGAIETTPGVPVEAFSRIPIVLPVTTTRWRLRMRNFNSSAAETEGGAGHSLAAAYIGAPAWTAKARWDGALAASPITKTNITETAISASADSVTGWVEAPELQFKQFKPAILSCGWKLAATKVFLDEYGPMYVGVASGVKKAGEATAPAGASVGTLFDTRIEYEYAVPTGTGPRSLVGIVIGDSIASGYQNTDGSGDGGAYVMNESWPGVAALREGHPIVNAGVGAALAATWNVANTNWRYTRVGLGTVPYDYAIVALGANDALVPTSLATYETEISAIIKKLQGLGIPSIYLATITPATYIEGKETKRVEYNTFLRTLPTGAQGVIEMDKQLALQGEPSKVDAAWGTLSEAKIHPLRAAYQRMAGALVLP